MAALGKVIAAAVQATPVFLDRDATVDVVISRTRDAAKLGAELIVFPETFIPTYPDWVWRAPAWEGASGDLYARLLENAVEIPGPVTETLGNGQAHTWTLHVGNSFSDVPTSSGQYRFVETIFHKGITNGCTASARPSPDTWG